MVAQSLPNILVCCFLSFILDVVSQSDLSVLSYQFAASEYGRRAPLTSKYMRSSLQYSYIFYPTNDIHFLYPRNISYP